MSNLQTLYAIYEAFGQGNIQTLLDNCSDSIEWEYGNGSVTAPWLQKESGKDGALRTLAGNMTIETHSFVPAAFLEGDGVIVVLFNTEFTVKETGKRVVETDGVHIWRFDDAGRVTHFQHRVDTHQQQLAYTG